MDMIDYGKTICITNRHLVKGDYFEQLERVFRLHPALVVVREKDLEEAEFFKLAQRVLDLGKKHGVRVAINSFYRTALLLGCEYVHIPLGSLEAMSWDDLKKFKGVGTSVHSEDDLFKAQDLGADYVFAGHVFLTDCKKGVPARGLDFLKGICENADMPVYAIGGITPENMGECLRAGASGVCMMSYFMEI